jgi:acetylornithine deacetylase
VPESARLTLSIRPAPGLRNAPLLAELTALIHAHAPNAVITVPVDNEPFEVDGPRVCRELGWGDAACIDLAFWTEAALLSAAGIDAVVYGPGEISHAHAPDESVELSQLAQAFNTFQKLIHGTG